MFKTFDLSSFGSHIRSLREAMGFTQTEIKEMSGVSVDTLRRIETGKVVLRFDTIVYLSHAYKADLLETLKNYSNSSILFQYYYRVEELIINNDINSLKKIEADFENDVNDDNQTPQLVCAPIKKQFKYILSGVREFYSNRPEESIDYLITAMRISHPAFDLEDFDAFKYSIFELLILLLIASTVSAKKQYSLCNDILRFALRTIDNSSKASNNNKLLWIKCHMSLSYNCHRMDDHHNALNYANTGVDYCINNHTLYSLAALLYRKGIAEYLTNQPDYLQSLQSSINTLIIQENHSLAEQYKTVTKEKYGIII